MTWGLRARQGCLRNRRCRDRAARWPSGSLRRAAAIIGIDVPGLIGSVEYDLASTADLEETERQVTALGGRMLTATADVRDMASLADAVAAGVERFGRLDTVDQTVPTG